MEKEMEAQEKTLQVLLIVRFIITLFVVGIVELILTTISDSFIMPFIADRFFHDHEMSEAFSTLALGRYTLGAFVAGIIFQITKILPLPLRLPLNSYIDRLIRTRERSFFISGEEGLIAKLPFQSKILMYLIILSIMLVLLIPYIIGAVRFAMVIMREFRKIGEMRMKAGKDYEKKRNLMIADIAHDLRTPITTVSGYAQALSDGLVKEEDKQVYLEAIRDKAAGMNDLINLLFDYTRLESEGYALNKEKTDICEEVRECAASLYTDAESAGMGMDVDIPEKSCSADIDRVQFRRVIVNLINNAIRHNQEGCDIGVFIYEDLARLNVAVADKGDPIPGDIADHLFEPFFMGDTSRNSRGGSGLGLSVAKKITDMHGFDLRLVQGRAIKDHNRLKGYNKAFVIGINMWYTD